MDAAATSAMAQLNNYMATLLALASLKPSYNTVSDAEYQGTTPTFGSVPVPAFDQLSDSDDALNAVEQAAGSAAPLNTGIATLLAEFRAKIEGPQARLDAVSAEAQAITISDLDFSEDNYIAQIIDEVKDAIKDSLTQGPGNSTATESGFYANDAARRNASNQKELDDTLGEFAGRGWRVPAEIMTDSAAAIMAKQAADSLTADREILIQQEALSLENRQKAIAAGVRYDQILLTLFEHKMQRALVVAKTVFKLGQDLASLKFAVLDGLMEGQREGLAVVAESRRIAMEGLRENTRRFGQAIDALISEAGSYLDAYQADAQGYEVAKRTEAEVAAFGLSENKINLETLLWNVHNGLAAADDNLSAFSKIAEIRLGAAKTGVDMQTQLARAARNAITSVVQLLSGDKYASAGTT